MYLSVCVRACVCLVYDAKQEDLNKIFGSPDSDEKMCFVRAVDKVGNETSRFD